MDRTGALTLRFKRGLPGAQAHPFRACARGGSLCGHRIDGDGDGGSRSDPGDSRHRFLRLPDPENVERLRRALKSVFAGDPNVDEITASDLNGEYPAIEYTPPHGRYSLDILSRLGETFRFEDLEWENLVVDDISIRVATPRMLYLMKKDTVRPLDRIDVDARRFESALGSTRRADGRQEVPIRGRHARTAASPSPSGGESASRLRAHGVDAPPSLRAAYTRRAQVPISRRGTSKQNCVTAWIGS
jgi:hypothetical protein